MKNNHDAVERMQRMKPAAGQSAESFGQDLYATHASIWSAHAGLNYGPNLADLPADQADYWLALAESRGAAKRKPRGKAGGK
jgi:hypothetical protein